ncbi:hypothetical protein CR513_14555, partial [Mucuna pruriens]
MEVIARYSQHTLLDRNLNIWPSLVHHYRPSKAIIVEGGFSGTSEFLTFLYSALKLKPALFIAFQSLRPSQSDSVASIRNRVSPSLCLAETVSDSIIHLHNADVGNSGSFISISNSINNTFTTDNSDFSEFSSFDINSKPNIATNTSHEPEQMENNDRTLKELATPDLEPAQSYELKSRLIYLLPKFHGLAGEDPHKHLKEFHVICSTMRLHGILEDYIKMKAFPFSLDEATNDWLYL